MASLGNGLTSSLINLLGSVDPSRLSSQTSLTPSISPADIFSSSGLTAAASPQGSSSSLLQPLVLLMSLLSSAGNGTDGSAVSGDTSNITSLLTSLLASCSGGASSTGSTLNPSALTGVNSTNPLGSLFSTNTNSLGYSSMFGSTNPIYSYISQMDAPSDDDPGISLNTDTTPPDDTGAADDGSADDGDASQ